MTQKSQKIQKRNAKIKKKVTKKNRNIHNINTRKKNTKYNRKLKMIMKGGVLTMSMVFQIYEKFIILNPILKEIENQYIFDYSDIQDGNDTTISYIRAHNSHIVIEQTKHEKKLIEDLLVHGINNSFHHVILKCFVWLGENNDDRTIRDLINNAWDSNLMSCEDIECLKGKKIMVNLKKDVNRMPYVEVINNGIPFPFPENNKEYTYQELLTFPNKYPKNKSHTVNSYPILGGEKMGLKLISEDPKYQISFQNIVLDGVVHSCVKLKKIQ
jgi:hypothetical protein